MAPIFCSLTASLRRAGTTRVDASTALQFCTLLRTVGSVLWSLEDSYVVLHPEVDYTPYTNLLETYADVERDVARGLRTQEFLEEVEAILLTAAREVGFGDTTGEAWWVVSLPPPRRHQRYVTWWLAGHAQAGELARTALENPAVEPELCTGAVLVRGPYWVYELLCYLVEQEPDRRGARSCGEACMDLDPGDAPYLVDLWRPNPENLYHDIQRARRAATALRQSSHR